jgi:hypothetical protein
MKIRIGLIVFSLGLAIIIGYVWQAGLVDALSAGTVDAVMAWEPRSYDIMKKMGSDAVVWPGHWR